MITRSTTRAPPSGRRVSEASHFAKSSDWHDRPQDALRSQDARTSGEAERSRRTLMVRLAGRASKPALQDKVISEVLRRWWTVSISQDYPFWIMLSWRPKIREIWRSLTRATTAQRCFRMSPLRCASNNESRARNVPARYASQARLQCA